MFSTTQMSHTVRVHLWGEGFSGFLALSAVGSSKCWGWWGVVELGPAGPPAHSIILSASQSGSVCAPLPPATPGPCKNNPLRKGRAPSFIELGGQAHPHTESICNAQTEQETKLQEHEHMPWVVSAQKISSKRIFKKIYKLSL